MMDLKRSFIRRFLILFVIFNFVIPVANARRQGKVFYRMKKNISNNQKSSLEKLVKRFEKRKKSKRLKPRHRRAFRRLEVREVSDQEEFVQQLKSSGLVEKIEEDKLVPMASNIPSDALVSSQWHHENIKSFSAWDITRGANIKVGVCDSGFDASHTDLKTQYALPGYNTVNDSSDFSAVNPHGTAVAGLISAAVNGVGGVGIAPDARIIPIRVSNRSDGSAFVSDLADCVYYAVERGAKVINISYSGAETLAIAEAAKHAKENGALLVMAAGNENQDISNFPDDSNFLIVGATTQSDRRSSFSNFGTAVDLVAPGTQVLTTNVSTSSDHNRYSRISGTSFASPIVAAAAALIYGVNPSFSNLTVQRLLTQNTFNLGNEFLYGNGLLNVDGAVNEAFKLIAPTPDPFPAPQAKAIVKGLQVLKYSLGSKSTQFIIGRIFDSNNHGQAGAKVTLDLSHGKSYIITSSTGGYFQIGIQGVSQSIQASVRTIEIESKIVDFIIE